MKRTIRLTDAELKKYISKIVNEAINLNSVGKISFVSDKFNGNGIEDVVKFFTNKGFKGTDSYVNGPDSMTYAMSNSDGTTKIDVIYSENKTVKNIIAYI